MMLVLLQIDILVRDIAISLDQLVLDSNLK
jgi:hypothetical protein